MRQTTATPDRTGPGSGNLGIGVLLVVLFTFAAWSLRVAFFDLDAALPDLTPAAVLNETLRFIAFVAPVLFYLRFVEKARATAFLRLGAPNRKVFWVLPLFGALFVGWYLFLGLLLGGAQTDVRAATVLFTVFSPAVLMEEIYFRGFLLNVFSRGMGFWRANAASSALFALVHFPGWFAMGFFAAPSVAFDALGIFVFGLVFGYAMKKTGSLWPAYALHALNNLLAVSLLGG